MLQLIRKLFNLPGVIPEPVPAVEEIEESDLIGNGGAFSTDLLDFKRIRKQQEHLASQYFKTTVRDHIVFDSAMDGAEQTQMGEALDAAIDTLKGQAAYSQQTIPSVQYYWYASQGYIGAQACAILAQNWLVDKACTMPARDAVRKGWEITINDGTKIAPEVLQEIRAADIKYRIKKHLVEFVRQGRIFGIRIAMFKVDSDDPQYYYKPFNIEGIRPGSYKGIVQIDPFWITPELDFKSASDPTSLFFYEPTWWRVNGVRIHRSHLIIMRPNEVPDILKPAYLYGGVPIPQKIAERVYAAERTANEAPQLALTKRTNVIKTDLPATVLDQQRLEARLTQQAYVRDNYGYQLIGENDEANQMDTSLADFDSVIMSQYQLAAAVANVPAVKLLGTTPKGFNASGEYEESNYHEELETIQEHDCVPLLERHYLLLVKSEIAPNAPFVVVAKFNPLDALTTKEQAEVNKLEAETDQIYLTSGAVNGEEVRTKLIAKPDSGYDGLEALMPEEPEEEGGFEISEEPEETAI